ncbi:MAG TPA: fatty acid desaturase [Anaerolineales bacterium]|nr:fatty acid desaturase [Anaerolineales bacterium]
MDSQTTALPGIKELKKKLDPFSKSDSNIAIRQLVVTLLLYGLGWLAMVYSLQIGYWLTLLLTIPTAGFLIRIFIFFHDCGHNSFLPSTQWNRRVGFWLGVLTFTPGAQWWRSHAIHHATSGNLDKRGVGDVMTLTVDEYQKLSALGKAGYRIFRHPAVMFIFGPIWMFVIQNRWPSIWHGKRETMSVVWTNLAIIAMATGISLVIGFKNYVLIQLPVIWLAGMAGIWLFYIQHQFQGVYWARGQEWDYVASAFKGASYYKLPKVLQWFSGNIGFHHIHHLNPRVPNYNLEKAYQSDELLRESPTLNIRESLSCIKLTLIDEQAGKLVGF